MRRVEPYAVPDLAAPPTKRPSHSGFNRRSFIAATAVGAAAIGSRAALAQQGDMGPVAPPSTVTSPPRDFGPNGAPTTYFWDPDIIAVDPSFNGLAQPNSAIQRLWTGGLWLEGPAWNGQGRYLVWSDIPNNRQMRWIEDDGHVSVFRLPSNNSNGNTFDYQGRQISCEHLTRRVVRYELDGSITVIADSWNGKRLNSPNDPVPHPDGSIWFTDPPYGGQLYEGTPDAPGGRPRGRRRCCGAGRGAGEAVGRRDVGRWSLVPGKLARRREGGTGRPTNNARHPRASGDPRCARPLRQRGDRPNDDLSAAVVG